MLQSETMLVTNTQVHQDSQNESEPEDDALRSLNSLLQTLSDTFIVTNDIQLRNTLLETEYRINATMNDEFYLHSIKNS